MADDIANDAIERLEKRLDAMERRLPLHDHGGEPACLACLQPLIEAAHVLALSHGERHGSEGEDPAMPSTQNKTSSGAPTNLAPEGTRCQVIPDNEDYINTDGSTAWVLLDAVGHTVVSHSDTTATGAELDELTDGSTTTLHTH